MHRHHPTHAARPPLLASGRLTMMATVLALLVGCQPHGDFAAAGQKYMQGGQYREAVIEFKNAVQANPASAPARALLADALERTHDLPGAETQLRKAVESGGDEQLMLRIAANLLDRSEFDKLVRDFKDRRLADPRADSSLRALVAMAYAGQKQPARSQEQLQGLVDTPAVALARAQLLATSGKLAEALALLPMPDAKAPPDTAAPWWVLRGAGRIAGAAGDPARALESIRLAHAAVPWHAGVTGEYGEALISAGRNAEATAVRDQLRKQSPNNFWTHYLDALLLARAGQVEASHAAALKALARSPQHLPAGLMAASAELSKGDLLIADKRLQTLVQEHPASLPALRLLVQSKMRSGKTDEAQAAISRGLGVAPNDTELLALRADLELARGARKEAAATLSTLAAARPRDLDVQLRLAEVKAGLGERKLATRLIDEAATAAGPDAALRGRIVATSLRMGYIDQARRLAEQSVALQPDAAQARLTLAAVQSAQNDGAAAWRTTQAVIDRQPALPAALAALSAMARTPAQRDEVRARFAKALDTGPAPAELYLHYASLLTGAAGTAGAQLPVLQRGVTALPGDLRLREALVEEQFRTGQFDQAMATAKAGAAANGAPAQALALLADVHERLGENQAALDIFRKLRTSHPQRADWRLRLARLEAANGGQTEAATLLRSLLKERPGDMAIYLELARLAQGTNPAEALSIARQMAERPELKGAAMLLEGDILAQTGKRDDALVQFAKAARAGMEPAATLRIVRTLDTAGRNTAADEEMANAMRRFRDNTAVVGFAAQRAMASSQPQKAVELLQSLAAAAPGNPMVLNDLAWAQIQAGNPDALANSRKAAAALPDNANVLHTLGMAQALAGQRDTAIATLRLAGNLAPRAALPRLHLSEQLLATGDRAGAAAALKAVDPTRLDDAQKASFAKLKSATGSS